MLTLPFELPGELGSGLLTARPVIPAVPLVPVTPRAIVPVQFMSGLWSVGPQRLLRGIHGRSARFSLLESGEVRFSRENVASSAEDYGAGTHDVWIRWDGTFIGRFRITHDDVTLSTSTAASSVTGRDYRYLLDKRPVRSALTWTGIDQAVMGWDIITAAQSWGDLGLRKASDWIDTGIVRDGVEFPAEESSLRALSTLAEMPNGFQPYVNPDLTVSLNHPLMGEDNGVVLSYIVTNDGYTPGGNIASVQRTADMGSYANVIRQSGAEGTTPVEVGAADAALSPQGAWVTSLGDTKLMTQDMVQAAGDVAHAALSQTWPEYSVILRDGAWQGPSHIWLGDTVLLVIKAGAFAVNRYVRVTEMNISWNSSDVATVSLALSKNNVGGVRALRQTIKDLKRLTLT